MRKWLDKSNGGIVLRVKVSAGAKQNKIVKDKRGASIYFGDFLKIKVTAPPEKGRANEAVRKLLAQYFEVPQQSIYIVRGKTKSLKVLFIPISYDYALAVINKYNK